MVHQPRVFFFFYFYSVMGKFMKCWGKITRTNPGTYQINPYIQNNRQANPTDGRSYLPPIYLKQPDQQGYAYRPVYPTLFLWLLRQPKRD